MPDVADLVPDADGRVTCPECRQTVRLGNGGINNLIKIHLPSRKCAEACKEQAKRTNQARDPRITQFFAAAPKKKLIPLAVTAPLPVIATPLPQTANQAEHLLQRLCDAIDSLPSSIPEANDGDVLAAFAYPPPENLDPSEAWEMLDPVLNRLVGWGKTAASFSEHVRRGEKGMDALHAYLEFFVNHYNIDGGLLEGKIRVMLDAIAICTGIPARSLDPSPPASPGVPTPTSHAKSPPIHHSTLESDSDSDIVCVEPASGHQYQCAGHIITFPPSRSPNANYPFMLHDVRALPWDYELRNGIFVVRSRTCSRFASTSGMCKPCIALKTNSMLNGIIDRMKNGVHQNAPYAYHGLGGLIEVARRKNNVIDTYRLQRLNNARKIVGLEGVVDIHKQILLAISSQRIQRIDRVFRAGFSRRLGLHAMLVMVKKAADGTYHPKGYEEEDDLQALLFLRLGGARVADIAHRIFGTPATSTIRQRTSIPLLLSSPSTPTLSEIRHNVEATFQDMSGLLTGSPGSAMHAVLMFDELATEKRPRWDDKTNKILGICRECGKGRCLDFSSMDDLQLLFEDLEKGTIHLASEATVGAIGLLSDNTRLYSARPVLLSGSCKRESAEEHAELLQTTINAINSRKDLTRARIVSVASDGEARRGKALVQLTFKSPLSPSSPIYYLLGQLPLMDLWVGDDDLTADKDFKHVAFKRVRNALLRDKGVLVSGIYLTPSILRSHLSDAGHSAIHIRSILNASDKQDVQTAYHLLRDIWSLPVAEADCTATYADTRKALQLFGSLCYHLVMPYICVDLDLAEQLAHLSTAAHIAMASDVQGVRRQDVEKELSGVSK
ncbi:hypothetical protein EVG20_g10072 [Dentipellis fragilis]|uniref:Uncharacterized protein n=1 Tax=Dentipellis fragilis TaxID=205917 RepID=A0A4Y9XVU7_9AGAM|nr:hypothetical protein EVG20_g10072 [Dentipellis fragilis]